MSTSPTSPVSVGDYAPSPNTCSQALTRANQLRLQALLRQLVEGDSGGGSQQQGRIDTLRKLRKTMRELDFQLNWLTQVDFLETSERILRDETAVETDWRLVHDSTQLLIETIPRLSFDLDQQTINQIFPLVVQNLGHQRSEVRRASLLLINMFINERPRHFQQILKLFVDFGLANQLNQQAQRGAILSLPLLMTEQVVVGEDLSLLIRSLSELLVDANNSQLFYSLYLALQRLNLTIGDEQFFGYLAGCSREARLLYDQAASRNNSVVQLPGEQSWRRSSLAKELSRPEVAESVEHSGKQVTFERRESGQAKPAPGEAQKQQDEEEMILNGSGTEAEGEGFLASGSSSSSGGSAGSSRNQGPPIAVSGCARRASNFDDLSSVSSTCSSQANLVEPSHYMSASALEGRPLSGFERIHHVDHSPTGLTINDINNSCSPTVELGPNAQHELKFGIFPRQLVNVSLNPAKSHLNRLEALQEMMCIIRDSPINHLAILMTYFDSFLEQFLGRLVANANSADYKIELVAIDMMETIVVKTKISTIQYIRPMVSLLVKTLADSRSIFRENSTRVLHKMMAFLPPQHVIDAIFEHKHSRSAVIREECVNRITAAILEYDKNEFNLTKLCYHVLPLLADQSGQVRLAALECIASLAHALGHERIGSLLTAAEAVQTGCDYDGLLDAINARLARRALPRLNSDGSIRFVLRPLLNQASSNFHLEQGAADVRWILEAPSSHQHAAGTGSEQLAEAHHAHRPGAYSPPEVGRAGQRRASVAPAALTVALSHQHHSHSHSHHGQPDANENESAAEADRKHRHHHHKPQELREAQPRRPQASELAEPTAANCSPSAPNSSREPGNRSPPTRPGRKSSQPEPAAAAEHANPAAAQVGQGNTSSETKQKNSAERRRPSRQSAESCAGSDWRRSNSQDSAASSADSNKLLFQYYLTKFRESLDAGRPKNRPSVGCSAAGSGPLNSGLPSDSIIYTEDAGQVYAASRNQSRYQQTSLEFAPEPAGGHSLNKQRKPVADDEQQQPAQSRKQSLGSLNQITTESSKRRASNHESASLSRHALESSSGSESPMTVMENFVKQTSSSGDERPAADRRKSVSSNSEARRESRAGGQGAASSQQHDRRKGSISSRQQVVGSEDGASERAKTPEEAARQRKQRNQLQRSQATVDSPPPASEASEPEQEVSSAGRERHLASQDSIQSSGSAQRKAELAGSRRRRSSSRRRASKSSGPGAAAETAGEAQDSESQESQSVRRRASRSQPPTRAGSRLARSSSKPQISAGANNSNNLSTPLTVTGGAGDQKRSVSVSPSFAVNINIRHILETVAEVEGPFQEPPLALKVALNALDGPCWSTKVEGLLALIRLAAHHQPLVVAHLHEIVYRLTLETRNLRSTVSRSAIFTLGDYAERLKKLVELEMDVIVQALLFKSMENTAFIRDDIRRALAQMCDNLTHWKLASLLIQHGASHKNTNVRRMASQFIALLVERMGPAKCLVGARDISGQLLPATAKFAQDQSLHTRFYGRLILSKLMQHGAFDRLMRKNLTPNLYRSSLGILESVRRRGAGEPPAE